MYWMFAVVSFSFDSLDPLSHVLAYCFLFLLRLRGELRRVAGSLLFSCPVFASDSLLWRSHLRPEWSQLPPTPHSDPMPLHLPPRALCLPGIQLPIFCGLRETPGALAWGCWAVGRTSRCGPAVCADAGWEAGLRSSMPSAVGSPWSLDAPRLSSS